MRWLGFAICAVVVLTLQTTLAWRLEIGGVRPDWMLVLAVFFTLHARSTDALIGAWLLGAAMDVYSSARFGLLSGCYAVTMLALYAVREYVFRDNPVTHFVVTFVCAAAIGTATTAYGIVTVGGVGAGVMTTLGTILLGAAYTAAWAPPLHYVLLRFPRLLGVHVPRRSYRARRRR